MALGKPNPLPTNSLVFPLTFKRQYAGPLDFDTVFGTVEQMKKFLTDPSRYAGQIVGCVETEQIYMLNATLDAWKPGADDTAIKEYIHKLKYRKIYFVDKLAVGPDGTGSLSDGSSWENAFTSLEQCFAALTNGAGVLETGITILITSGEYSVTKKIGAYYNVDLEIIGGCNNKRSMGLSTNELTTIKQSFDLDKSDLDNTSFAILVNINKFLLRNIKFEDFVVENTWGLIYCQGSKNTRFENIHFENCTNTTAETLLYLRGTPSSVTSSSYVAKYEMENIIFNNCVLPVSGTKDGSCISLNAADLIIKNLIAKNCHVNYGILTLLSDSVALADNILLENIAGSWSGIYLSENSTMVLARSVVKNNNPDWGVYCSSQGSKFTIYNTLMYGNVVNNPEYGMFTNNSPDAELFVYNSTLITPLLYNSNTDSDFMVRFKNCIIQAETFASESDVQYGTIENCVLNKEWTGSIGDDNLSNLIADPQFINAELHDYRLQQASPAIAYGKLTEEEKNLYYLNPIINKDLQDRFRLGGDFGNFNMKLDAGCYEMEILPGLKSFSMEFQDTDYVNVEHNLNGYPGVDIFSDGKYIIGDVTYMGPDTLSVAFNKKLTGTIICK